LSSISRFAKKALKTKTENQSYLGQTEGIRQGGPELVCPKRGKCWLLHSGSSARSSRLKKLPSAHQVTVLQTVIPSGITLGISLLAADS
jgi:hypothetical protein